MCPKPPDVPNEGIAEHLPIAIPLEPVKTCVLDSENIILTCKSFMSVYVTDVTYGRNSSTAKVLCDGEKPPDSKSLGSGTCYDDNHNAHLLHNIAVECHGQYNCSYNVPTVPLTTSCDGLKREVRVEHICGEHVYYAINLVLFKN